MNKIKIVSIIFLTVILCGCKEYGEKRIVKLVTIDQEKISLYYYDYTQEKTAYLTEEKDNDGIENTMTELLSSHEYNLKLCRYVICDSEIIQFDLENVFKALINLKFSPDVSILEGDTENSEKYIEYAESNYPLYKYKIINDSINGIVYNADNKESNVIIDSMIYKTLDKEESFVLDIITDNVREGEYTFIHNGKIYSSKLENISVFYLVENDVLNINITANIKNYKGMPSNEESKKIFADILCRNISVNVENLYNDSVIEENFNLHWYKNVETYNLLNVNVCI